jgi:hypothetical protein
MVEEGVSVEFGVGVWSGSIECEFGVGVWSVGEGVEVRE